MYYKKPSALKPVITCMIIFGVIAGYTCYSIPDPTHTAAMNLVMSLIMAVSASMVGAIVGFVLYMFFRPTNTDFLLQQQNDLLSNNFNNQYSKADELKKILDLKKSGAITEDEYNRLKNDILKTT